MNHGTPQFGERAAYGPDDVCYRHADRHTFTLCQRCGNNICSECQTPSPVGVLCPACVRAASPSVSTRAGRRARATSRAMRDSATPIITYSLMVVSALVFVGQLLAPSVTAALWYVPVYSLPQAFEPWRMFTVMFTHSPSSYLHILFNMLALWIFGRELERSLGKLTYLLLYILSGWGGSIGVMLWGYTSPDALVTPTVGASGAIFGLLGATFIGMRALNVNVTSLAVLIAINLGIGFLPGSNISWQAHLGGMLVGMLTMTVWVNTAGPRRRVARIGATLAVVVLLVVLSMAFLLVDPARPYG